MSGDEMEDEVEGLQVLIDALKAQEVRYIFGIVGIPILEVAMAAQQNGILFIAMRNEQAACYAAQAMGYLTGRPGVCLVVSGPGVLHTIGGISNAKENCWPLLVLGGASDTDQESMGAFQECPQVEACRPYCKYSVRPPSAEKLPYVIHQAFKRAMYGRPGPCYVDLPGDFLRKNVLAENVQSFPRVPKPPPILACPEEVKRAAKMLKEAKSPLVIVGKGAAYGRAEAGIRSFLDLSSIPFLPTPMGKGVVADDHPLCVSAARSLALREADVILLLGARLNWMLHFGTAPRFSPNVKFIQVDVCQEEFHTCVETTLPLSGDVQSVIKQLISAYQRPVGDNCSAWRARLLDKIKDNKITTMKLINDTSLPLNYYATFNELQKHFPSNTFFVSEGANTMDIGRSFLLNKYPRHRLDAGTFGTMGVGLGFAIAAAFWVKDYSPRTRVVCVEGDSAFGFSGMELETIYRYQLPIIVIIINNNGIYGGLEESVFSSLGEEGDRGLVLPPSSLLPNTHYEKFPTFFGDEGYLCHTTDHIRAAMEEALSRDKPSVINIMINPSSQRKAQDHDWLTRSKL